MTKFFTNQDGNTLKKRLQNILKHHKNIEFLEFLIGYFRVSGFREIASLIGDKKTRILVGIDVDKITLRADELGKEKNLFSLDSASEEFKKEAIEEINSSNYSKEIEESILLLADYIRKKRVQIKIHTSKRVHSKIYILREELNYDGVVEQRGSVITGSSNLSDSGLSKNYEFNVELNSNDDITFALNEFEKLWFESRELCEDDVAKIKSKTYLKEITPYELYIRFLIENFEDIIDIEDVDFLPKNFFRLSYQIDAVNEGIKKLKKHNGFFLSDVVGLGKTITTSMIVKKLLLSGLKGEILIITPPSIKREWEESFESFHIGELRNYKIVTIGNLKKITTPQKYSLVIIDESHKFKNLNTNRYKEIERVTKESSIYKKKVILISATPLNNSPEDLANQIYLFQDKRYSTIPSVINLENFFAQIKKEYKELGKSIKESGEIDKEKIKKISEKINRDILKEIMVRRTRRDILENPMYLEDFKQQGLSIPEIDGPNEIFYKLDDSFAKLFTKTVDIIEKLDFTRYKLLRYLKPKAREKFGKNLSQNIFEKGALELAGLMKIHFAKRFESSFYAFKISIKRQYQYLEKLIKSFEDDKILIGGNVRDIFDLDEDRLESFLEDGRLKEFRQDDFESKTLELLKRDFELIKSLNSIWKNVEDDPKLQRLKESLKNRREKVVIFTESKDTAYYIGEELKKESKKILVVTGENREKLKQKIRENFDANYKNKKDEFDVIVTTDTLAEAVNLHRSNLIYNYDIPWNATKLMQRIGRINRIGTKFKKIFVYNFIPSALSEEYLQLTQKAFIKLQTFHLTLGEDSKIFTQKEEVNTLELFENIEEVDEELEFLAELREFKNKNPKAYEKIKKLPPKIRVQRDGKRESFVFLKTKKQKAYIKVENSQASFINFLDMAKALKSAPEERAKRVEDSHYQDVKIAIDFYKSELKRLIESQTKIKVNHKFDKKAIRILKGFRDKGLIENSDFEILEEALQKGKVQNLAKEIKEIKDASNLKELIKKYGFTKEKEQNRVSLEIDIVLSESFG